MFELWKKIIATGGAKFYGIFIGIFTLSITARYLGPEGRGIIASVISWVTMFSIFLHFSLGQIFILSLSKNEQKDALSDGISTLIFSIVSFTLLGWLIAALLYMYTDTFITIEQSFLIIGFLMLPFFIWESYASYIFTGLEKINTYNKAQVLGRTVSGLVLVISILYLNGGVEAALLSTFLGQLVVFIFCASSIYQFVELSTKKLLKNLLLFFKDGVKLHFNAICAFLVSGVDVIMVNNFKGPEEAGYYQLGAQLLSLTLILPQAASMIIYGRIGTLGAVKAWTSQKKILFQTLLIMLLLALIAALTADYFILLIAGDKFYPTVDLFRLQLISVIGMSISIIMASQWVARGYLIASSVLGITISILNLIGNYLLIPTYGMYGAAYSTIFVYTVAIFVNGWMYFKCERTTNE